AEKEVKQAKTQAKKVKSEKKVESLKKSKYVLLKNGEDLKEPQENKLKAVQEASKSLSQMYELKEEIRRIFEESKDWLSGVLKLGSWLKRAKKYFPSSCQTVSRWLPEIVSYFDQRTTSGVVEGINNKLKLIKRSGYGFRNFDNFRVRCLLNWHFNY
ncbi:MAG: transposase, partial [Cyanobacteriota bacterium]|nr:transposase [Cyanobacteriota bacterium]